MGEEANEDLQNIKNIWEVQICKQYQEPISVTDVTPCSQETLNFLKYFYHRPMMDIVARAKPKLSFCAIIVLDHNPSKLDKMIEYSRNSNVCIGMETDLTHISEEKILPYFIPQKATESLLIADDSWLTFVNIEEFENPDAAI